MGVSLRFGFVDAETADGVTYPVRFEDRDRQVLDLLAVRERNTETAYAKNDHVACLLTDGGDTGVILGVVDATENKNPQILKIGILTLDMAGGGADLAGNLAADDVNAASITADDVTADQVTAGGHPLSGHIHQAPGGFGGPTSGPQP